MGIALEHVHCPVAAHTGDFHWVESLLKKPRYAFVAQIMETQVRNPSARCRSCKGNTDGMRGDVEDLASVQLHGFQ